MSRKKVELKYKKERVILSDVLPYEMPVTFSNSYFYNFILQYNIEFVNDSIIWDEDDNALDEIVKLLFGLGPNLQVVQLSVNRYGKEKKIKKINNLKSKSLISIPFVYKISHKEYSFRELAVCHPKNQLILIEFYNRFKELILYYCNTSNFSIRRPKKISRYVYHKDKTHYEMLSEDGIGIEETEQEYQNLRSFFVYKDYSNIYKFFESYHYHRCEKQFNALTRLDITKCFNSIYTHTISWALLNKDGVKKEICQSKKTFSGIFDRLMQQLNYNETNGIIIGPEFSRIFAELILQAVDRAVQVCLEKSYGLIHRQDYQVFRYVDDYFIFYNSASEKDSIVEQIQIQLKKYNLYLNEHKAVTYNKPIITEITMAKQRIAKLLEEALEYKLEEMKFDSTDVNTEDRDQTIIKGEININSKTLIIQFKTILKECEVEYKDILNYALAVVERKSDKILRNHHCVTKEYRLEKPLIKAIRNILEFVFFIYSVSPRVNTTIKLARILRIYIAYLKGKEVNHDFRHLVFKDVYDNICFILEKNKNGEYAQVETLYLLITLTELGKDYWLDKNSLANIFGLIENETGDYYCSYVLNYFSISVILFYMKDKKRYSKIKDFIEYQVIEKYRNNQVDFREDCELTLLLMDCLTCPFVSIETKTVLLEHYSITDPTLQQQIINKVKFWFTKWNNFNLGKALDMKQSLEVY